MLKKICGAIAVVSVCGSLLFAQQPEAWKIVPNADGKSVAMTYANPPTSLSIESELNLSVDASGAALNGSIKFKSGLTRPMSPEEVAFYYNSYKGEASYWNFRQTQGSVSIVTLGIDPIPNSFYGQYVRAISKDGMSYFGTINSLPTSPDWFAVISKGNRILFYRYAVKEIQVLK
jgi:hypothetical protein